MAKSQTAPIQLGSERLPFMTKLIYGLGDWGNTTTSTIFGFFFAFFLNNVAGVQPLYAFPVLLVGGIWDAINDPIIGVWSDRIRTRWGRRRPFFLVGAIPYAFTFILLFCVPPVQSQLGKCIYYSFVYILFDTMFTLVTVPYTALTPELTEDYDERTRLNGYRMFVSMAGGLISAIALPMIVDAFINKAQGYLVTAVIFGSLAGIPYLLLFFFIKERHQDAPRSDLNIFSGFAYTWHNIAFRYASGIYMTAWVTVSLAGALFQYYLTYWLHMPRQVDIVLGVMMLSATIFIPVMVWLANKMGKQKAYMLAVGWWVLVMLAISFLPQRAGVLVYFLAASAGFGVAAAHVIPWSIVPDVIESDELERGYRREGTFYGFMVFLQKTGSAAALGLMQLVLHFSGYITPAAGIPAENYAQPASAILAIRFLIGPLPAILLVISMFLTWKFPINKEKHEQIRAALVEKRKSAALEIE